MKTLIIDSSCLAYQAAYSMGGLSYEESPTGIIYGFLRQVENLARFNYTCRFVFSWDSKESIRRDRYPRYKRKPGSADSEKLDVINSVKEQTFRLRDYILPEIGFVNHFTVPGFESDDVIASLVQTNKGPFVIVSTDGDLKQLLDYADIYIPGKKRRKLDRDIFMDETGITPRQWAEVKALAGCSSDNVPGIPGIGEKSAISYLRKTLKGKKLEAIESDLGKRIRERNRWLVKLPHPDFREETKIKKEGKFSIQAFDFICEEYGITTLDRDFWITQFDME